MDSQTERTLSAKQIHERLVQVRDSTAFLNPQYKAMPDKWARLLTLHDIWRFCNLNSHTLNAVSMPVPRKECLLGCKVIDDCRSGCGGRPITGWLRTELSRFFLALDRGDIVKAKLNGRWVLVWARTLPADYDPGAPKPLYAPVAAPHPVYDPASPVPPPALLHSPPAAPPAGSRQINMVLDRASLGLKVV